MGSILTPLTQVQQRNCTVTINGVSQSLVLKGVLEFDIELLIYKPEQEIIIPDVTISRPSPGRLKQTGMEYSHQTIEKLGQAIEKLDVIITFNGIDEHFTLQAGYVLDSEDYNNKRHIIEFSKNRIETYSKEECPYKIGLKYDLKNHCVLLKYLEMNAK